MYRTLATALSLALLGASPAAAQQSPPVIAGLAHDGLSPVDRGLVLMSELGCASCHDLGAQPGLELAKSAPDLARVGERVLHPYLRKFIANPRAVEPGTTMPDVMHGMDAGARDAAAEVLLHFLLSGSEKRARPEGPDPKAFDKGQQLFHEVGCVACHAPRDKSARETAGVVANAVPLGPLAGKYTVTSLMKFLESPGRVRASHRMPNFNLSPQELYDISHYLLQDAKATQPLELDPAKVAAGKQKFAELGCASCHSLDGVATPTQRTIRESAGGCVSGKRGAWPHFALSGSQRTDIIAALSAGEQTPDPEREIRRTLATLNCIACHQRGKFGGIPEDRNEFFTTEDENLGEAGRLPPTLTGVGAKLQSAWLSEAIGYGQAIRNSVKTRMPGFGGASGAHLAKLFGSVDELAPAKITELPRNRKAAGEVRKVGHQLVGNKGMNCITCHTFAGLRADAMQAVDLVASTGQRLRPEWFYHYMRDPFRFAPDVVMPQFFPDGKSTRPDIAGGDVDTQISSIWHYLAEGRNSRRPSGLIRESMEIKVANEAVMLRRKVQNTGKRGISVGYPGGVNVTFDAESLSLNQIWWGRFVDASGVWAGQGSGAARIMERNRTDLGLGPTFAKLGSPTAEWPTAGRRELAHEFLGYSLDDKQRPTFRYRCYGMTIEDACVETKTASGRVTLKRTLKLRGIGARTLHMRVVREAKLNEASKGVVEVGRHLRIRLPAGSYRIRPSGKAQELVVAIQIRAGRSEFVIEYEENRK